MAREMRRLVALRYGLPLATLLLLTCHGLNWGLPSEERNVLYFGEDKPTIPELSPEELEAPWAHFPNIAKELRVGGPPRWGFNPLRSYHPDEYVVLKSLSGMIPSKLKFFHGFFGWPALHFYTVGLGLRGAALVGYVELKPDPSYYVENPEAIARMYMVGRGITVLFACLVVFVLQLAVTRLYGPTEGFLAATFLSATPLLIVNGHYMTADVAMLFWITLTFLFAAMVMRNGEWKWYLLAGACVGLATATRYKGALAAVAVVGAHLCGWKPLSGKKFLRLILAGVLAVAIFCATNPYIFVHWGQFLTEISGELRGSKAVTFGWAGSLWAFSRTGLGLPLLALAVAGFAACIVGHHREDIFLLVCFLPPLLLLAAGRPVMARYYMPVLLLPPLLAGRAAGSFLAKRGRWRTAAGVVTTLVFASLLVRSLAMGGMYAGENTRTTAGQWISSAIPGGSSIGVINEPWQFELPPLNHRKYDVRVVGMDAGRLEAEKPDFFVYSDLQLPPLAVRGPLRKEENLFWRLVKGERYVLAACFDDAPTVFSVDLSVRRAPQDMRYVNPTISVYKRIDRESSSRGEGSPQQGD